MKELALNDLYHDGGETLGTVQSFGTAPPGAVVLAEAEEAISARAPRLGALLRLFLPLLAWCFDQTVGRRLRRAVILATILEDAPRAENRVEPLPDGELGLTYRIGLTDGARIARARRRMAELLRPYRVLLLGQAESNHRLAHACGTCRAGADPRTSVVDPGNRAHGMHNLYVVDASFFPTSGGMNPSLTLAANGERVAAQIVAEDAAATGRRAVGA